MSMLAERQWMQKWTVDPRNTAWSNDDSKFGQRMLEKLGWSKGKGLGAQEQGATDHIKVQVKNNHLGLGATVNNEDNWIAHQDDFNQLLAELNACHGQETTDSSDNKEKKTFSLEEKSKISKNCVHYMKFTKGKDLSSWSKRDLDCIFVKRQSKKTPEDDDSSPSPPDGNVSSTTMTSAFTIEEYFAKWMVELKNKPQVIAAGSDLEENRIERKRRKKRKKGAKDKNVETYTEPQAEKNRDQVERQLGDLCWDGNSGVSAEDGEDCVWPPDDQDITPKPKKRKEKKNYKIKLK